MITELKWAFISAKNNHTLFPFSVHRPALLDSYFTPPLTLNTASPWIITFSWWPGFHTAENTDNHIFRSSRCLPTSILHRLPCSWVSSLCSRHLACVLCIPLLSLIQGGAQQFSSLSFLNHSFPLFTESFPLAFRHAVISTMQNRVTPTRFCLYCPHIFLLTSQNALEELFVFTLPIPFLFTATASTLIHLHHFTELLFSKASITFTALDVLVRAPCSPDLVQQQCLTWLVHLSSLAFSGHGTFPVFVLPHPIPHGFLGLRTVPWVDSILGVLALELGPPLFPIFYPYSPPWWTHPVPCRWLLNLSLVQFFYK